MSEQHNHSQENRNREAWLTDFTALLMPLVKSRTGLSLGAGAYRISCGFPSRGGTSNKNRTIGQCHHIGGTGRKTHELFIHPQLADGVEVGAVIAHEILHAALPAGVGHRKPFSRAAKALGLDGKPTATVAGEELTERLKEIVDQLGEYPHESLNHFGMPKQSTRLLKCMCPLCGYIVRVTSKWLDEAGAPICPQCSISMEEAGTGEQAASPLYAADQTVEYKVKAIKLRPSDPTFDPRWSVRMNRQGLNIKWWVIDYGAAIDERGMAVLGVVQARLTPAESREDALSLLEALRDGTMTYNDITVNDDDPDLDVDDPFYEDEDEDETFDYEEDDSDPRFAWEKEKGISVEDIDPEDEADKREGWVRGE